MMDISLADRLRRYQWILSVRELVQKSEKADCISSKTSPTCTCAILIFVFFIISKTPKLCL